MWLSTKVYNLKVYNYEINLQQSLYIAILYVTKCISNVSYTQQNLNATFFICNKAYTHNYFNKFIRNKVYINKVNTH